MSVIVVEWNELEISPKSLSNSIMCNVSFNAIFGAALNLFVELNSSSHVNLTSNNDLGEFTVRNSSGVESELTQHFIIG